MTVIFPTLLMHLAKRDQMKNEKVYYFSGNLPEKGVLEVEISSGKKVRRRRKVEKGQVANRYAFETVPVEDIQIGVRPDDSFARAVAAKS